MSPWLTFSGDVPKLIMGTSISEGARRDGVFLVPRALRFGFLGVA